MEQDPQEYEKLAVDEADSAEFEKLGLEFVESAEKSGVTFDCWERWPFAITAQPTRTFRSR